MFTTGAQRFKQLKDSNEHFYKLVEDGNLRVDAVELRNVFDNNGKRVALIQTVIYQDVNEIGGNEG